MKPSTLTAALLHDDATVFAHIMEDLNARLDAGLRLALAKTTAKAIADLYAAKVAYDAQEQAPTVAPQAHPLDRVRAAITAREQATGECNISSHNKRVVKELAEAAQAPKDLVQFILRNPGYRTKGAAP